MDSQPCLAAVDATVIAVEAPHHDMLINSLTDKIFGPGRRVKTAERLREANTPYRDLCLVAMQGYELQGSVRLWPVQIKADKAEVAEDIAFLGPIVVGPAFQGAGVGSKLIEAALTKAFDKGVRAVILVGDFDYFRRFGFERAQGITLPGPVDPKRLLIRYADDQAALKGKVSAVR